ncbi:type II secretion system F family protein [Nocardia sp. 004]|uniref:type II secretion system F family protein n=1 Tax=Nocardia sp. 004 TaxID=3385978 RepID=UPI0039A24525
MSLVLVCIAMALVVAPAPIARRRFVRIFRTAGNRGKPEKAVVLRVGASAGLAAVLAFLGPGPFLAAVMITGTAGLRLHSAIRDRRRSIERGHLLDALEAMIAELRVGAHPGAAAEVVAHEVRGEPAQAFAVGAARSKLGGSVAEGLYRPDSLIAAELSRIAGAWQVAERHGLALGELLAASRVDLAGRIRFQGRTTAALAGARATAVVLACLPCLGIALGHVMGASPLHVLFGSPVGAVLLPLGAGLVCTGLLWTDAITRKVLV